MWCVYWKKNKNETKTKQNKIENTITECCNVKKTKCIEPWAKSEAKLQETLSRMWGKINFTPLRMVK